MRIHGQPVVHIALSIRPDRHALAISASTQLEDRLVLLDGSWRARRILCCRRGGQASQRPEDGRSEDIRSEPALRVSRSEAAEKKMPGFSRPVKIGAERKFKALDCVRAETGCQAGGTWGPNQGPKRFSPSLGPFPQETGLHAWREAAALAEWQGVNPGPSSRGCSTFQPRARAVRSDGHGRLADRAEYQFVECAGDNHDEREPGAAKQWLDRTL